MFVQCAALNVFFLLSPLICLFMPPCLQTFSLFHNFYSFTLNYFLQLFYFLQFTQWLVLIFFRNNFPFPSSSPSLGPLPGCLGGEYQRKLYRDLMENYNRLERPVQNDSAPIVVELGLTLLQIIDVVSVYMHGNSMECQITSNVPALFTVCVLFPSDLFSNQEEHSVVSALHCSALAGQKPLRPKKLQALRPRVPMTTICANLVSLSDSFIS